MFSSNKRVAIATTGVVATLSATDCVSFAAAKKDCCQSMPSWLVGQKPVDTVDDLNSCCWQELKATDKSTVDLFKPNDFDQLSYRAALILTGQEERGDQQTILDWTQDPGLVDDKDTNTPIVYQLKADGSVDKIRSVYWWQDEDDLENNRFFVVDPQSEDSTTAKLGYGGLTATMEDAAGNWKVSVSHIEPLNNMDRFTWSDDLLRLPKIEKLVEIQFAPLDALKREIVTPKDSVYNADQKYQLKIAERLRNYMHARETKKNCCGKKDECCGKKGACDSCANAAQCDCCNCCATCPKCCQNHACLLGYVLPLGITGVVATIASIIYACDMNSAHETAQKVLPAAFCPTPEQTENDTPVAEEKKSCCSTCCIVLIVVIAIAVIAVLVAFCRSGSRDEEEDEDEETDMESGEDK